MFSLSLEKSIIFPAEVFPQLTLVFLFTRVCDWSIYSLPFGGGLGSLTFEMWCILSVSSKYKEHINAEYFSAFSCIQSNWQLCLSWTSFWSGRSLGAAVSSKRGSCLSVWFVLLYNSCPWVQFLMYLPGSVPCASIGNVLWRRKDSIVVKSVFNSVRTQPILPKSGVSSWDHGSLLHLCGSIKPTNQKTFKRPHWKNLNNSSECICRSIVHLRALTAVPVEYCSFARGVSIYLPCRAFWIDQNLV